MFFFAEPKQPRACSINTLAMWTASFLLAYFAQPSVSNAQTVSFAGARTTVTTGYTSSHVDRMGNLWVTTVSPQQVVKFSPEGAKTTIQPGFLPRGVVADDAGNAFVANNSGGSLVKIAPSGAQTVVASGLANADSVARNSSGIFYVCSNDTLWKVSTDGQVAVLRKELYNASVAVDSTDQVYIVQQKGPQPGLYRVEANGSLSLLTSLIDPSALAIDGAGNKYVTLLTTGKVVRIAADGSSSTVADNLGMPAGISVSSNGDLFVTETSSNRRLIKISRSSVQFPATNICPAGQAPPVPCKEALDLEYDITATGTLGSIKVLTDGIPSLDFTQSANTCTGTVTAGSTCKVSVVFAPRSPGLRRGAVQLTNASGAVLATTYISGAGVGPQMSFGTALSSKAVDIRTLGAAYSTVVEGLSNPGGMAVDAAGNLFIASKDRVVKVTPEGVQSTIADAARAVGVAVDGAGNVFIADQGRGSVVKVSPDGTQREVAHLACYGIAVDAAGNLFVSDTSRFVKIAPDGSINVLASDVVPYGAATDGNGNAYFASSNQIVKFSPAGVRSTVQFTFIPTSMAIGLGGDIFAAAGGIERVQPDGTRNLIFVENPIEGVALDASGNIYISEFLSGRIMKLNFAMSPSLSFPATSIGSTSAAQSVTINNVGNAPLSVSSLGLPSTFDQVGGPPAECGSIQPGKNCSFGIRFKPFVPGTVRASAVLTSNALNANPATHTIPLSGVGEKADQIITFETISAAQSVDAVVALTARSSSGLPVSFASTTPAICSVAGATATTLATGTCMIQATQAGDAQYAAATPVTQGFLVNKKGQTITFGTIAAQQAGASVALSATSDANLPVSFASSTPAVCTVSGSMATTLTTGTCTIQATQDGNAQYAPATPAMQSFVVNKKGQTITFGTIAAQQAGASVALAATSDSNLPVSFASSTPAVCTVSGNTATTLTTGTCRIQATQDGNAQYAPATPAMQSFVVNKKGQTITFGTIAAQQVGTSVALAAMSDSNLTVSFASTTPAVCTVSGSTATTLMTGTCTIQATQAGDAQYAAATPAVRGFTVNPKGQTITFAAIASQPTGTTVSLSASANSNLPVSFASTTPTICTVSGSTAKTLVAGTCTIQATQAGNAQYTAAAPVTNSFTVTPAASFTIKPVLGTETIKRGVLAAFILELRSVNGFKGDVKLTCSGGPDGSYCANLPQIVRLNGTAYAASGMLFPAKTPNGIYTVTFTGASGSQAVTSTAKFTIK